VIAFAWTALRPDDLSLQAGITVNRAKNWQEFLNSAKDFSSPQQNIVYADVRRQYRLYRAGPDTDSQAGQRSQRTGACTGLGCALRLERLYPVREPAAAVQSRIAPRHYRQPKNCGRRL